MDSYTKTLKKGIIYYFFGSIPFGYLLFTSKDLLEIISLFVSWLLFSNAFIQIGAAGIIKELEELEEDEEEE